MGPVYIEHSSHVKTSDKNIFAYASFMQEVKQNIFSVLTLDSPSNCIELLFKCILKEEIHHMSTAMIYSV